MTYRPRADGDVRLTPLPPGETLTLRTGQSVLRLRLDGGAADIAHNTPSGARAYFPALQPLAQPIERAMTGRPVAPLRLSLDARLQQAAQDALAAGVAAVRSSAPPGAKSEPGDAFKAAVTVMDTTSGQVLAIASWPLAETELAEQRPGDVARVGLGEALGADHRLAGLGAQRRCLGGVGAVARVGPGDLRLALTHVSGCLALSGVVGGIGGRVGICCRVGHA